MDIGFHQIADRGKDHAVARQRQLAFESIAYDQDIKMTATIACSGVAGVAVALIDDIELNRMQCRFDGGPDFLDSNITFHLEKPA